MEKKTGVIILGAGPAGLASAYELVKCGKRVIVLEKDAQVGGISRTIKFQGCFFDLGGHRFHTELREVSDLWEEILGDDFLVRPRLSRIYYRNKLFNYPLTPVNALFGLGIWEASGIILSYIKSKLFPFKEEKTFEQWVSNRFGKKLFTIFFKTYTEKVWGIPCEELLSDWSAQRIGKLSLFEAVKNSFLLNKNVTSKTLIDKFRYPKYGPGMMYEKMAKKIIQAGGEIILDADVKKIEYANGHIESILVEKAGKIVEYQAQNFISTVPINSLVKMISPQADEAVNEAARGLKFRSFISVSVILECPNPFLDNWIYIHSPAVKLGRIQNFQNWSPFMIDVENKTTLGLEYFCDAGDTFWQMSDDAMIEFALTEMEKLNFIKKQDFVAGFVSRVPKAYPMYQGDYADRLKIIRAYLDKFKNLQTIGRGGMFRYNNMDHSILAGLWAAKNIMGEENNIWEIND